jgi:hypothetical protein
MLHRWKRHAYSKSCTRKYGHSVNAVRVVYIRTYYVQVVIVRSFIAERRYKRISRTHRTHSIDLLSNIISMNFCPWDIPMLTLNASTPPVFSRNKPFFYCSAQTPLPRRPWVSSSTISYRARAFRLVGRAAAATRPSVHPGVDT